MHIKKGEDTVNDLIFFSILIFFFFFGGVSVCLPQVQT